MWLGVGLAESAPLPRLISALKGHSPLVGLDVSPVNPDFGHSSAQVSGCR
jgi:hypothetical protein